MEHSHLDLGQMKTARPATAIYACMMLAAALELAFLAAPPATATEVPVPSKRPAIEKGPVTQTKPASGDEESPADSKIDESVLRECEEHMHSLGVRFTRRKAIRGENGCGIAAPYEITAIAGSVTIQPPAILACETAIALSGWVQGAALPYAEKLPGKPALTGLRNASGYVCRGRNNNPSAKLSEHALGRAIDISAFLFEGGTQIAVEPRQRTGRPQEAYQKAVRFAACLHFTTVLGPYSDANHNDHLHLDIAERRGGYRLCDFPDLPDAGAQ